MNGTELDNPGSSPFISNTDRTKKETKAKQPVSQAFYAASNTFGMAPEYINAKYTQLDVPVLDQFQEQQVKEAIDASKKVIENAEWKTVEKNIADVLTQKEKEQLKKEYRKELNKVDWDQWENKLRTAYNNVDWSRVNEQLSKAVNVIRMDSLQKVYNAALVKIDLTTNQLAACDIKGIPDSDISLRSLAEQKLKIQKELDKLKANRTKKIVHL